MMTEDRYEFQDQLGVGGAGSVYKVWDRRLQRFLAVKQLLPAEQRSTGGDLEKEAAALSALQHPNVVSVFDLDEWQGQPCLCMEFLNGENLDETVGRGKIELEDFLIIAQHCLEGLKAAHAVNIQHRDIKPSNIMVTWLPDGTYVTKMLDFGLAEFSVRARNQQTEAGRIYGSIHFMAPEQFHNRPIDGRTDLYSLGAVLYYLLTCAFPFNGNTNDEIIDAHLAAKPVPILELRPELPPLYAEWVMWLMSRHPDRRPQSVVDAANALQGIKSGRLVALPMANKLKTQPIQIRNDSDLTKQHTAPVAKTTQAHVPPAPAPASMAKWLGLGTAAAALIAGTVYLAGKQKSAAPAGPEPTTPAVPAPASPHITRNPPSEGMVIWVDGDSGMKNAKGNLDAKAGQPIDLWMDRQAQEGANHLHYLFSKFTLKEYNFPTLAEITSQYGLVGKHRVAKFAIESNFALHTTETPDTSPEIKRNGEFFNGPCHTVVLLFRSAKLGRGNIYCGGKNHEMADWLVGTKNGEIFGEVGTPPRQCELSLDAPDGFNLVFVERDNTTSSLTLFRGDARSEQFMSDTVTLNSPAAHPVERVRMGRSNEVKRSRTDDFEGEIAMLMVYTRALSLADRQAVGSYVGQRYFGR